MVPRLVRLRPPYRSGVGPIVKPHIRPSRRALLVYRAWHPVLRVAVVMAVALLAALAPGMQGAALGPTLLLILAYTGWLLLLHGVERQPWLKERPAGQMGLSALRKAGALAGLTLLLWWNPGLSREAWLLYLLPMLTIGVDLNREWAATLVGLAMALALFSPFAHAAYRGSHLAWGDPLWLLALRDGLIRALVVGFSGISTYLLHHAIAYQYQRMEVINQELETVTSNPDWRSAANGLAQLLDRLFSSNAAKVTAYVLSHQPETQTMRIEGSSNPKGVQLAQEQFQFPAARGITGWTAAHRQPCFLNDTHDDPEQRFLVSAASPDTRSALAVPAPLDEENCAVLEVESTLPNDFVSEDLQLMNLITTQLKISRRRTREVEMHRSLAELGKRIACRTDGAAALDALLEEVGEAACRWLRADVVRFYYQSPTLDPAGAPPLRVKSIGRLLSTRQSSPPNDPHSIIQRLMRRTEPVYFRSAQQSPELTAYQSWHLRHGVAPFVVREQIACCAAIPLVTGNHCVGLMWVNYRQPRPFTRSLKARIGLVAPFAMLAIHSAQQSVLAENRRRQEFQSMIHDSLWRNTHQAAQAVAMLHAQLPGSEEWQRWALLAGVQTARANRIANVLQGGQEYLTLDAVVEDLRNEASLCESLYQVKASVDVAIEAGAAETPIGLEGGSELMMACDEVVKNALQYAKPSRIAMGVTVDDHSLRIVIEDDGCGFDLAAVGPRSGHGLENVRSRIEVSLNGRLEIATQPGAGTRIAMLLPLPNAPHPAGSPAHPA